MMILFNTLLNLFFNLLFNSLFNMLLNLRFNLLLNLLLNLRLDLLFNMLLKLLLQPFICFRCLGLLFDLSAVWICCAAEFVTKCVTHSITKSLIKSPRHQIYYCCIKIIINEVWRADMFALG